MTQPEHHGVLYKDGSLRGRGQMHDDEMYGDWEWFRLDGTIMRSGSFDRGRQIGNWTTYDGAGAPYRRPVRRLASYLRPKEDRLAGSVP
ncbi:hypothetical protein LQ938_11615 [Microbacterium sp. cx-55]|uniref:toxin-antitoxin system YwqK family antitoxin n=1 Tax=Microbacterium sp. cx-55 TaxID=2875948 RepID=UPI001CC12017|nr:hypothetical protein [Microbacterium sp. cx-55]MBZ4488080.1 hypothetical protein [Microbacterium sp. cx-55]UGB34514.1 hypothetical protein LQ938_11615 [Microbacterium sp. cx-55]